jgi:hypothetical protein
MRARITTRIAMYSTAIVLTLFTILTYYWST